jgi:hypothetical protein
MKTKSTVMELKDAILTLRGYNTWRRGDENYTQPDPRVIGEAIDAVVDGYEALLRERDEWKAKFIQQNKDLGCELMDPNGTIWDYAKKVQSEILTVTKVLDEARGQRDRLAEALQKIRCLCRQEIPDLDCYCRDCEMLNTIDDALQSLTTKP